MLQCTSITRRAWHAVRVADTVYLRFGKRLFDLVAVIATVPMWMPLMGLVALVVRLTQGSPVIFRQLRPGLHAQPFDLMKFRTMTSDRDRNGKLLSDSVRLTRVGRFLRAFSLDELPELTHVLRGEMSLVGPRPLVEEDLERCTTEIGQRFEVRPGMTGWVQVNGRNALPWRRKFEMDLWYVENCSFWTDVKILAMTVWPVVTAAGVFPRDFSPASKACGGSDARGQISENQARFAPEVMEETNRRNRPTVDVLGAKIDRIDLDGAVDRIADWIDHPSDVTRIVVATGFHGLWVAQQDPRFLRILNSADLFCPDGIAPVWISRLQGDALPARVPGPSLMAAVLDAANEQGFSSFFYGDSNETLEALKGRLEQRFPGHRIAGMRSPPFRALDAAENEAMVQEINAARPDILWVALGLPKQEIWIEEHRKQLKVPVVIAVGAAFGFLSGRVSRTPKWIGDAGFEWAWRLAAEPKKLWRRDLIDGPRFLVRVARDLARSKVRRDVFSPRRFPGNQDPRRNGPPVS